MNKAFTANINDQVTARGYLDENDQLIMLEPEGSGGGDGSFKKATFKLNNSGSADSTRLPIPMVVNISDKDVIVASENIPLNVEINIAVPCAINLEDQSVDDLFQNISGEYETASSYDENILIIKSNFTADFTPGGGEV